MADDEFNNLGSGKYWWDASSSRTAAPSISTTLNAASIPSFGWPREAAPPGGHDQSSTANPNLQIMGLGLISSQPIHWNVQTLFRGEKAESSFRPMLEEEHHLSSSSDINTSNNFDEQERWRSQKLYSGGGSPEESSVSDFKQMNHHHHHHHHHHQFSPLATSNDESTITSSSHNLTAAGTFHQTEYSSAAYGLLLSENQQQPMNNSNNNNNNYLYPSSRYGEILPPSWNNNSNNKFPPKPEEEAAPSSSSLHFTNNNNTPFWNASPQPNEAARSSFFPTLQTKVSAAPSFDEKPKNTLEARDFSTKTTTKIKSSSSSNTETSNNNNNNNKRPRNETPTPLPAFKVRKEKMGDRITALQQLVSPFGKTDTASVLSDAIEYIKFLHDQISALSDPYMKNAASIQHRHQLQNRVTKSKDGEGGRDQDLRSRGLCLVPVSSTFPVAHETTVDFWTPTFGGATFR